VGLVFPEGNSSLLEPLLGATFLDNTACNLELATLGVREAATGVVHYADEDEESEAKLLGWPTQPCNAMVQVGAGALAAVLVVNGSTVRVTLSEIVSMDAVLPRRGRWNVVRCQPQALCRNDDVTSLVL